MPLSRGRGGRRGHGGGPGKGRMVEAEARRSVPAVRRWGRGRGGGAAVGRSGPDVVNKFLGEEFSVRNGVLCGEREAQVFLRESCSCPGFIATGASCRRGARNQKQGPAPPAVHRDLLELPELFVVVCVRAECPKHALVPWKVPTELCLPFHALWRAEADCLA